jgi:hypothetical protein
MNVPRTTATLRLNASRRRLPSAAGSSPSDPVRFVVNAFQTSAGEGRSFGENQPAS